MKVENNCRQSCETIVHAHVCGLCSFMIFKTCDFLLTMIIHLYPLHANSVGTMGNPSSGTKEFYHEVWNFCGLHFHFFCDEFRPFL